MRAVQDSTEQYCMAGYGKEPTVSSTVPLATVASSLATVVSRPWWQAQAKQYFVDKKWATFRLSGRVYHTWSGG